MVANIIFFIYFLRLETMDTTASFVIFPKPSMSGT